MAAGMLVAKPAAAAYIDDAMPTSGDIGWSSTPGTGTRDGDDDDQKVKAMTPTKLIADVVDEDELFELDIALLDARDDDDHRCRHRSDAGADDDADAGHALLANCLLPLRSVSNAAPVAASSMLSSPSYPYSGYFSSRRLLITGRSRRFLGRSAGSSARLCFSSRGFEATGNYFQRY